MVCEFLITVPEEANILLKPGGQLSRGNFPVYIFRFLSRVSSRFPFRKCLENRKAKSVPDFHIVETQIL